MTPDLGPEIEKLIEAATRPLAMGVEQYYGNFPDAMEGSAELIEERLRALALRVQEIERERCAKVADDYRRTGGAKLDGPLWSCRYAYAAEIAKAIREGTR